MPQVVFVGGLGSNWFASQPVYDEHGQQIGQITNWSTNDFPTSIDEAIIPNGFGVAIDNGWSIQIASLLVGDTGGLSVGQATFRVSSTVTVNSNGSGHGTLSFTNSTAIFGDDIVNAGVINLTGLPGNFVPTLGLGKTDTNLSGGGKVEMTGGVIGVDATAPAAVTLHNVDNTISGTGTIGDLNGDGLLQIDNQAHGTIEAQAFPGNPPGNLAPLLLTATTHNAGLLGALASAVLEIETTVTQAAAGVIKADGASAKVFLDGTIAGGHLQTANGGAIVVTSLNAIIDSTTAAGIVHNEGDLEIAPPIDNISGGEDPAALTLKGTLDNTGSLTVHSVVTAKTLHADAGGATLSGGGTVVLEKDDGDAGDNVIAGPGTLHNVDNTISGAGTIGADQFQPNGLHLDNQAGGTIVADNAAAALTINALGVANAGLIEDTAAGGLVIDNTVVTQTGGGAIKAAGDNAKVAITDTTVIGGQIATQGSGAEIDLTNAVFDGVTLSSTDGSFRVLAQNDPFEDPFVTTFDSTTTAGNVHNAGAVVVDDDATLVLNGTIDNSGTITTEAIGADTTIQAGAAGVTLTGGGKVIFGVPDGQASPGVAEFTGHDTTTRVTLHNADNTISGSGAIGSGAQVPDAGFLLALDNQAHGIIVADNPDGALTLRTGTTIQNAGILAADGGKLVIGDDVSGNGVGLIAHGGTIQVGVVFSDDIAFDQEVGFAGGAGAGTLKLGPTYSGTIHGLSEGDAVVAQNISFFAVDKVVWTENKANTGGTLKISRQDTHTTETLHFAGIYDKGDFTTAADSQNLLTIGVANVIEGTQFADVLAGGKANERFAGLGGRDTINGGGGSDTVDFRDKTAAVVATLHGATATTVKVGGKAEDSIRNVENILGGSGADKLTGDGHNNTLNGEAGNDLLNLAAGGKSTALGGAGNDTIRFDAAFTAADHVDGGAGMDTLTLNGNYKAGVHLGATTLTNVETIAVAAGHSYALTTVDETVAKNQSLTVNGSKLHAADKLAFDGSAETNGAFVLKGGAGADRLIGGAKVDTILGGGGGDVLTGGKGADILDGGAGADRFVYHGAADSTGRQHDTIDHFDFAQDRLDVVGRIAQIDAAVHGTLSAKSFDKGLAAALGTSELGANHAVLFTADGGTLKGDTFLVIDQNKHAGYQAGVDLVIEIDHAAHLAQFGVSDFV
ncbi:MAG TPA: bluetail domain-containing putative surface protein [Hyphomicrobiales bacterium]|nr:bluetail domain-containing putative surface protein [Hyphomicrobiales bacterium]